MKIFSAKHIREWDQYTIQHEPITSIDLMERAASQCADWILHAIPTSPDFHIFCATGNNGGDGLAIARLLVVEYGRRATVYIHEPGHSKSKDFEKNLSRLSEYPQIEVKNIRSVSDFPSLGRENIIIDALFGTGLNRPLEGLSKELVKMINAAKENGAKVISIDIPSGLMSDRSSKGDSIVKADDTITFQVYKPAFMMAENTGYIGHVHLLDIGLHPDFYNDTAGDYHYTLDAEVKKIYRPRNPGSHKGTFGHALIVAGSYGKMGAAMLCGQASLRSGVGLLSYHIPQGGYNIIQTSVPEAMVMTDYNSSFITRIETDLDKYAAIGIGPGIGTASETCNVLQYLLKTCKKPMVLDADALNNMAQQKEMLKSLRPGTILTPHPKEFERLFGETADEFARVLLALEKAKEYQVVIVLKGHHTLIATPEGKGHFNSTGNAGMATGGSGDVLTGILTGLVAQGYKPQEAAILGVYLHGLAGDLAAAALSQEALIAGDIIVHLGDAFKIVSSRISL